MIKQLGEQQQNIIKENIKAAVTHGTNLPRLCKAYKHIKNIFSGFLSRIVADFPPYLLLVVKKKIIIFIKGHKQSTT